VICLQSGHGPVIADSGWRKSRRVATPRYDRSRLLPGVVHIGVGGFHRAHQAVYFDELATQGVTDWGIVGVCVQSHEVAEALAAQDNMFTVVERQGTDCSARIIGALVDVTVLADDPEGVRRRLADPRTRMVTLTITGDGYTAPHSRTDVGRSVFGVIARALNDRRRHGRPPFTVLSCDNLPDSGAAARRAVLNHAAAIDARLAAWITHEVTFPESMVDRITPGTTDEDRAWVRDKLAVADLAPVMTEGFSQWVVQDAFCNGRPPLERVGVRFVDDVGPYKLIKSRMLNGAHCALAYVGYLAGHRSTDDAMADPVIVDYVDWLLADEVAPLLPKDVSGMALENYRRSLLERLSNAAIADPLSRLCRRGTTKMADYLLPSLTEARASERPHQLLLLAAAAWMRYLRGTDLSGAEIEIVDPRRELIGQAAALPLHDGVRLLVHRLDAFAELRTDPTFVDDLLEAVDELDARGVRPVLGQLVRPRLAS
jgi:mannitol 2-dehydrogenase